jgi:cyclopropane-fatty-acyl-phospholipid synthase
VLELGCGWGSLSLFMAQIFPNSSITAVSNSSTQRSFIMQRAQELKVTNLQVLTANMVDFKVIIPLRALGGVATCAAG